MPVKNMVLDPKTFQTSVKCESYDKSITVLLRFLGIRFEHQHKLSFCKKLIGPSNIALHVSFLYTVYALLGEKNPPPRLHIVGALCYVLSLALWYHMQIKSGQFRNFLWSLQRRKIPLDDVKGKRLSMIGVTTAISFPIILSILVTIALRLDRRDSYIEFWLLGWNLQHNPSAEISLTFVCTIVYFSLKFLIPALSVALHVILCYQLSEAIRRQGQAMEESIHKGTLSSEIKKYLSIAYCCKQFSNCSKGTVLLMCSFYFSAMYTGIGVALGGTGVSLPKSVSAVESILTIIGCVFSVVSLMGYAAEIPEAMTNTAERFQELYTEALLDTNRGFSVMELALLKSMSDFKPVHLTVCGLLSVKRSLILSSFGCTLTYCILIMQLKKTDYTE